MRRHTVRLWALACLALCGVTACSAMWAAAHPPTRQWYDDAESALRGLEAHDPESPRIKALREKFDRLRREFP